MKSPHPKRAQAKRAKAKKRKALCAFASIFDDGSLHSAVSHKEAGWESPVLVLPLSTAKQARAAARFWNLGEEERHTALSEMFRQHGHPVNCDYLATHVLNLIAPK